MISHNFLFLSLIVMFQFNKIKCIIGENTAKGFWHDYETSKPLSEEDLKDLLPEGHTYDLYNSTEDRILMGGTTADNSFDNIYNAMIPILKTKFGNSLHFLHMRLGTSKENDLDDWGCPPGPDYRPTIVKLFIVSTRFINKTVDDRHAMVHEALREEMVKREAGCAIDIHADTPEEWEEFKARNDFDEIKGKPDYRARSLKKQPPISKKDAALRDKIYKYISMHFEPIVLHVVDSKDIHPVDNDNPAFDCLIVSNRFSNLTITQRTILVHDYLRDYINEGIQFRLHTILSPEEVFPDRFNEDGFETIRLSPVHSIKERLSLNKIYVPPPKHVQELDYALMNNHSLIKKAKEDLRAWEKWKAYLALQQQQQKQAAAG